MTDALREFLDGARIDAAEGNAAGAVDEEVARSHAQADAAGAEPIDRRVAGGTDRIDRARRRAVDVGPVDVAFDAELLLMLISQGKEIRFIPITWREEDQRSTVGNLSVGFLLLRILLRWVLLNRTRAK